MKSISSSPKKVVKKKITLRIITDIIELEEQVVAIMQENRFHSDANRVRVTDVARAAGCAPATVSRVLNTPEKVSPETRERIQNAMIELGYLRNHAARSLRSQTTNIVGILIPTLEYAIYASIVGSASEKLSENDKSALIATFEYDLDREYREARLLVEQGAEGLVLIGNLHRPELISLLKTFNIPHVHTYVHDPNNDSPTVGFDNAAAAAKATKFLIQLGHVNFAVLTGPLFENDRTSERLRGVNDALANSHIKLDPESIYESSYSIAAARKATAKILANKTKKRPTALICSNDVLALGAVLECESSDLHVPNDISIIGFDNLELSTHHTPNLTTLHVPAREMGASAAQTVLEMIEGQTTVSHITVPVDLITRDSTAPPSKPT